MDYQVQLFDTRAGGFARKPRLEFGYRTAAPVAPSKNSRTIADTNPSASANSSWSGSSSTPKHGTRYTRGSTMNSLFARGYGDGVVLIWDYRNGGQKVRVLSGGWHVSLPRYPLVPIEHPVCLLALTSWSLHPC